MLFVVYIFHLATSFIAGPKSALTQVPGGREINQLDWTRAWANRQLVDYYRGLIALRMRPSEDNFSDRRCTRLKRWLGVFAAISSPWSLRVTEKAAEVDA